MIRYSETRPPRSYFIHLRIHRLIDIEHLTALFTAKMIMIITSGIEPA
jgi:hypothetical protein